MCRLSPRDTRARAPLELHLSFFFFWIFFPPLSRLLFHPRVPSGKIRNPTELTFRFSSLCVHPQVSLPQLDAEPPISDADDVRFDVRREKQVLADEGLSTTDGGARGGGGGGDGLSSPGAHANGGGLGLGDASSDREGAGSRAGVEDPTSLEATVQRLVNAPEDPVVDKYVRMGYKRDAVIFGERRGFGNFLSFFLFFSPIPYISFFFPRKQKPRSRAS